MAEAPAAAPKIQETNVKRKYCRDGCFQAELAAFFVRELAEDGYAGVEVRTNTMRTDIIIKASKTQSILGEKGRRILELTSLISKRFGFPPNAVELYCERVQFRGLSAEIQAESLKYKLAQGLPVRRACYGIIRYIMEAGAKGCECRINGKLRQQRSKMMKFRDGYMLKSGTATRFWCEKATRHLLLKQGIMGIQVVIMKPYDEEGKKGPKRLLADQVIIQEPPKYVPPPPPQAIHRVPPQLPQQQVAPFPPQALPQGVIPQQLPQGVLPQQPLAPQIPQQPFFPQQPIPQQFALPVQQPQVPVQAPAVIPQQQFAPAPQMQFRPQ